MTDVTLIAASTSTDWRMRHKRLHTYDVALSGEVIGQVRAIVLTHYKMAGRIRVRDYHRVCWQYGVDGEWPMRWGYYTRRDAINALIEARKEACNAME